MVIFNRKQHFDPKGQMAYLHGTAFVIPKYFPLGLKKAFTLQSSTIMTLNLDSADSIKGISYDASDLTSVDLTTLSVDAPCAAIVANGPMFISTNGTSLYVPYNGTAGNEGLVRILLSAPYDFTSMTYIGFVNTVTINDLFTECDSFAVSEDGTKVMCCVSNSTIFSFNLLTPWLLSTADVTSYQTYDVTDALTEGETSCVSSSGLYVYIAYLLTSASTTHIRRFALATAFDTSSSITVTESPSLPSVIDHPWPDQIAGMYLNDSGKRIFCTLYSAGNPGAATSYYSTIDLPRPFDITSIIY